MTKIIQFESQTDAALNDLQEILFEKYTLGYHDVVFLLTLLQRQVMDTYLGVDE